MSTIAMIPARMGSQRLRQKNLQPLGGIPVIAHAIRKCLAAGCFDEVWVNSEDDAFKRIAAAEGARFHKRPAALANNQATSEDFVEEFLQVHPCNRLFQVHSIAPLLTVRDITSFVAAMANEDCDVLLSYVEEVLECAMAGKPVNFTFAKKANSQDLEPIQRVVWSITGWRRRTFLEARAAGRCATYAGEVGFHSVSRIAGHVIKTAEDLAIAEALLPLIGGVQPSQAGPAAA